MVKKHSHKKTSLHWEHNSVVGQSYVRIFFALILSVYSYLGHTYNWYGSPPILLFHVSVVYLVLMSLFLLVAGYSRSFTWPFIIVGLLFDVSFSTYAMLEGGISTFYLYGIYLWIIIGYGLRFGRKYMVIANVLCIFGFTLVINYAEFWKQYPYIGWGLMLWIVLMPIYIGKLLSKLEAAVSAADEANKSKSRFLANMSHEIRTPLTTVIGYSEMALDTDQTTEQRLSALTIIQSSSRHLLNLINNILDFSKIDANELEIECIEMDPVKMVAEVESIINIQAKKKSLEFIVKYESVLPALIRSDPIRIKQILLNLCSNAIKFTEQGSVHVNVKFDEPLKMLSIIVADTGIGMTEEQCQKVFLPFKQADSSVTRKFGGTGLGLSLSSQLANLLHCHLSVQSVPNKGSRFILKIPCKNLDGDSPMCCRIENTSQQESTTSDLATNHQPLLSGDILLAEDNEINQLLISKYLKKMGANVTIANNGQEAVEKATEKEFDLIYMDMQMPVMSGTDAIKTLRNKGYSKPIVVLTANTTKEDRLNCSNSGSDEFITKPIVRIKLYDMTARYLPTATNK